MMNHNGLMSLVGDIRFWIILFFVVRLYGITFPPLESIHNIRQTDGLMIARNFYERDSNIFFPMVDVAGEKSGIVGCEFPLLNYLIYLMSLPFGFENWYGRLINLVTSSLGVYFFHRLIRIHFNDKVAFNASIILLVSLWFTYSRKTIPDTFATSICIASLYYGFKYFGSGRWHHLIIFFFLGLLACLAKISVIAILTILALPVLFATHSIKRKMAISMLAVVILSVVFTWYFYWVPYLNATYEYKMFFMGMPMSEGSKQLMEHWRVALSRFYDTPLKYSGFLAFLLGIYMIVRKKDWLPLAIFMLPFSAFIMVVLKAGITFIGNEYYMILMVPPMAFIAGYGLAQLNNQKLVTFALFVISVEGIANKIHDFRIRQPYASLEKLETIFDEVSHRTDLIAINGGAESGTAMFCAHRRGWRVSPELFTDNSYMEYLKNNGCKFILIIRKHPWVDLNLDLPKVFESEYFKIYKLQ